MKKNKKSFFNKFIIIGIVGYFLALLSSILDEPGLASVMSGIMVISILIGLSNKSGEGD